MTAKEAARETKREVRSAQRGMDREIRELDRQEKTVLMDIKKRAKIAGVSKSDSALRALSKQLVHVRQSKDQLQNSKSQIGSLSLKATAMASQVAAATAVGNVTSAMGAANNAINIGKMTKEMAEFMKQNETMDLKEELFNDALADAFDGEDVEEEADAVTDQVINFYFCTLFSPPFGYLIALTPLPLSSLLSHATSTLRATSTGIGGAWFGACRPNGRNKRSFCGPTSFRGRKD